MPSERAGPLATAQRILVDGALVVLPIGGIVLLILGLVSRIRHAADPLAGHVLHPAVTGVLGLLLICVLVGALVRSAAGRRARAVIEATILDRVPGYRLARTFAADGPYLEGSGRAMRPALAAIEEGQCPALVMDTLADGRMVVFVPGSPAPMSGAVYLFTPDKVTLLDVPLLPFLRMIASWGIGLGEMVEKAEARRLEASR